MQRKKLNTYSLNINVNIEANSRGKLQVEWVGRSCALLWQNNTKNFGSLCSVAGVRKLGTQGIPIRLHHLKLSTPLMVKFHILAIHDFLEYTCRLNINVSINPFLRTDSSPVTACDLFSLIESLEYDISV